MCVVNEQERCLFYLKEYLVSHLLFSFLLSGQWESVLLWDPDRPRDGLYLKRPLVTLVIGILEFGSFGHP